MKKSFGYDSSSAYKDKQTVIRDRCGPGSHEWDALEPNMVETNVMKRGPISIDFLYVIVTYFPFSCRRERYRY